MSEAGYVGVLGERLDIRVRNFVARSLVLELFV